MKRIQVILGAVLLAAVQVQALPFNDDMVNSQLKTGQVVRGKAPGTVPVGAAKYYLENKAEAAQLKNPRPRDPSSAARGERLFRVNCYPCHGTPAAENYKPGPVAPFALMPGPNLVSSAYDENPEGGFKSDGDLFSVIRFGGLAIMPALGWKLSHSETWDIVNYIRRVQGE